MLGFGLLAFSWSVGAVGSLGSAAFGAGRLVLAVGVEGQGADDFAGGGVDDADVEVVDEKDDRCAGVGSADADVEEPSVDSQGDFAGFVDSVVADPELAVGLVVGDGFGSCGVGDCGCRVMRE